MDSENTEKDPIRRSKLLGRFLLVMEEEREGRKFAVHEYLWSLTPEEREEYRKIFDEIGVDFDNELSPPVYRRTSWADFISPTWLKIFSRESTNMTLA